MDFHDRIDALRARYLARILALTEEVATHSTPKGSNLIEMCRYHYATGGKRLRALFPLLVAEALGADPERVVPFAAACEMLHNATLVHDDLQDGDTVRRDHPTIWAQYGQSQAINLGDAMFYYAVLLLQRLDTSLEMRDALVQMLLTETLKVIDGQDLEFALEGCRIPTSGQYFRMVEGKTSGLFRLPMAGSAKLCSASDDIIDAMSEAATNLGVLFQIQDDLLDMFGNKGRGASGNDIAEGKRSLLVVHTLQSSSPEEQTSLLAILDLPRNRTGAEDIECARRMFERHGALRHAVDEVSHRHATAISAVHGLDPKLAELIEGIGTVMLEPIHHLMSVDPSGAYPAIEEGETHR